MYCNSDTAITTTTQEVGSFVGSNALSTFATELLSFYQTVDNTRTYTITANDQFDALSQLLNGEADVVCNKFMITSIQHCLI